MGVMGSTNVIGDFLTVSARSQLFSLAFGNYCLLPTAQLEVKLKRNYMSKMHTIILNLFFKYVRAIIACTLIDK